MRRWVGAIVVGLGLALPVSAEGAYVSSMSVYSDPGDFVAQGVNRVAHAGNTRSIGAIVELGALAAGAQREGDEGYGVEMAPPPGGRLEPFNHRDTRRYPFNDAHPGLTVSGGSRGCNSSSGNYEIVDFAQNPDGTVKRLWALYEHHCEGNEPATWGEVRVNAWVPDAMAAMAPGVVRWPETDSWETATAVPVAYTGSAAATSVSIAGAHPGDFAITGNGCAGRAGPCEVTVRATPTAPGSRTATLRIVDAAGRVHESSLEAFRHGGTTDADLEVLPGDAAGTPGRYTFSPADAKFYGGTLMPRHGGITVEESYRTYWFADLYAGMNGTLAPGAYPNGRGDNHGPEPGVRVEGPKTGCTRTSGAFTINSMSHQPDGTLRTMDVSVENGCYEDKRPALRGRLRFRAGANEPLAPWMIPGPRPGVTAPPDPPPAPPQNPGAVGPSPQVVPAPSPGVSPAARALAATLLNDSRAVRASCPAGVERGARLLRGTAAGDRLLGRAGADLIVAGPGRDRVLARGGRDCVAGGAGADRLEGGSGADVLLGQGGDDVLVGGPGRDLLDCGSGRRDRAIADRADRTRGCERVSRPRPLRRR